MMKTEWTLKTHGDPLGTLSNFIHSIWMEQNLDSMLLPINGSSDAIPKQRMITDPKQIGEVNPFIPVMTLNVAKLVPEFIQDHPDTRFGVLLRPCEMRTLIEMVKHDSFTFDKIVTFCVDCLGTYPVEEYKWQLERKKSSHSLTRETVQFARQGGILAYRYRESCQICKSPQAQGADININVIGLPVREQILINTKDKNTSVRFKLDKITDGLASSKMVSQHERVLSRLTERNKRTMDRVMQGLSEVLPADVDSFIEQLEICGECQECINVCPICAVDRPQQNHDGHYIVDDVKRWLVSCAGCGMCEQACPNHLPLSTIFRHINDTLAKELGYEVGMSLKEPLPI
jgi:formate dehydrogenase subunit beta